MIIIRYIIRFRIQLLFVLFSFINLHAQTTFIPADLRVDLVRHTDKVWKNGLEVNRSLEQAKEENNVYQTARIKSVKPCFYWVIHSEERGTYQSAYQILVASSEKKLLSNIGDVWNSGKVFSDQQTGIEYKGKALEPNKVYYWKVKIWDNKGLVSSFSKASSFLTDSMLVAYATPFSPILKTGQHPLIKKKLNNGNAFYDFGKDAFGQLSLTIKTSGEHDTLRVHLGEAVNENGEVDRHPKGVIRYRLLSIPLRKGKHRYQPAYKRSLMQRAVRMPNYIGEVMPFRYAETESTNPDIKVISTERYAVNYIFNGNATRFESSDTTLNEVWDLCKYTMKATSFTGYYIDGDRERTPYEADAFINQLSYYASDAEYNMAKRSLEYLVYHATWPTEWSLQNLLIAWNDYLYSGDIRTIEKLYDELKPKTLSALARPDGLISTRKGKQDSIFVRSLHLIDFDGKAAIRDIVDWPQKGGVGLRPDAIGETDNFVFTDYNSVVNAFHYASLVCMGKLAAVLGKKEDSIYYKQQALQVKKSFLKTFIDSVTGLVKDGEGTLHSSLHANMMALAFGLVPANNITKVMAFIRSKGMACSVYGAQFLLDAVYNADDAAYGLKLLTLTDKRSWYNMIRTGSTMTTEAWDLEYKGNEDWNHAWGSAPANIVVQKLMGINPLSPAFGTIEIKPQVDTLSYAKLNLATLRGNVHTEIHQTLQKFQLETTLPPNMTGIIYLPKKNTSDKIFRNGKKIIAASESGFWVIRNVFPGKNLWLVDYVNE